METLGPSKKIKVVILVIFLVFLMSGIAFSSSWQWIGPARVHEMLSEGSGLWFVDLRSSAAFASGHIEGSVNIPAMELRFKKYPASKTVILVDDTLGQKTARETAGQLSQNGQERVYVLDGGIAAWELEGYPVVKEKPLVRAVTKEELKWALANMVPLKIFDMRDASEREKGSIQGSQPVEGKDIPERLGNIRELLKKEAGTDIAKRLKKKTAVVLVFPETEDAAGLTEKMLRDVKADVRYLFGGYRTFAMDKMKQPRMSGSCPACPAQ